MLSAMASYNNVLSDGVWTGIHDLVSEGDFMSLDGVSASEMPLEWVRGEPSDKGDHENCVKLADSGQVADVRCINRYPYFCRKENASMIVNKDCHTTADGYQYNARTGSCYKFHPVAQPWHRAARICHAEGGHLAIVNSQIESEQLREIYEKYPPHTLSGADFDYVAFIGVWKWNDDRGNWMTIYGKYYRSSNSKKRLKGHLAIVNSQIESEQLREIYEKYPPHTLSGADFDCVAFIGVWKWNDDRGNWMTIYGQTLEEAGFAVWGENQPNNNGGKQTCCSIERDGTLNDAQPAINLAFFCEITP
ncbi:uncharacterized protein LOC125227407 [Leguminivora glycinivorella]|uniref:uncharacterized protein LOC125227407 n=1 Tax=Leguminivora glycinivorella TaxID=1035111 RepID=UPI00200C4210|nr:uncharacterized protein LOC125227407 [Leguminivora glycinivorella]